jgi:hypothetical protein
MKLVNRGTFLRLPIGTIYSKFEPCIAGAPQLKDETILNSEETRGIDWFYQDLVEPNLMENMIDLISSTGRADLDDAGQRDGCFDEDEFYLIWQPKDLQQLIANLQAAIPIAEDIDTKLTDFKPEGPQVLYELSTPTPWPEEQVNFIHKRGFTPCRVIIEE